MNSGFIGWGGPSPFNGALLQRVNITTAVATITLSPPPNFSDLRIMIAGRGDAASNNVDLQLQFNGDTGGSQYNFGLVGATNGSQGSESLNQALIKLGSFTSATATAGRASYHRVFIPQYSSALFHKGVMSLNMLSVSDTTTGTQEYLLSGVWKSTAPITSILLKLGSGNFTNGTEVRLYGE